MVISVQRNFADWTPLILPNRILTYGLMMFLVIIGSLEAVAQQERRVEKKMAPSAEWMVLDSNTVYWPSVKAKSLDGFSIDFEIDTLRNAIRILNSSNDSIWVTFRSFGFNLHTERYRKDTTLIYNPVKGIENPFLYDAEPQNQDFFGGADLKKAGSISRGINFGNSQDLSVNSSLNMQLSGDISPNLKMMASLSDDNIPIQADGNTNKLQEFDRLFIQLYNDDFKLIAGDFWMKKPQGYFMTYNKRAQGLMGEYRGYLNEEKTKSWKVYGGGAFSKGKFNRQLLQGVEGNQGPYRLRGAENETFIIVLAGTERVFLNGIELERGQEYDYVMNYNTSEITFTPRRPIDKDSRIIVEFQYSDQNYARSLFAGGLEYKSQKARFWINAFSEQDAKNQTIQQELSAEQRFYLGTIGDSLNKALVFSVDSVGFRENQVMYRLVDTLGYDSVLVFSVNPDNAFYSAAFSFVGEGNGDYVFDQFTALGRVYRWVEPVSGVSQGNYAPVRIVITPKKRQMVTAGAELDLNKGLRLFSEVSYSNNDVNTFSDLDKKDNQSIAARMNLLSTTKIGKDSLSPWQFKSNTGVEFTRQHFTQIERFRSAEFERDWNVQNEKIDGYQFMGMTDLRVEHKRNGFLGVSGETFLWGNEFTGYKGGFNGQWAKKGFAAKWTSSVLGTNGVRESFFTRHMIDVSQTIWKLKIGIWDEYELNKTVPREADYPITRASYQFLDWKVYLTQADSTKNKFQLYYRQRNDQFSDSFALRQAARAHNIGGSFDWLSNAASQLRTLVNYRVLQITDNNLIQLQPENTLLGRIEYNLNAWKGALRLTTFYEVGSGLELKREFIYIEVVAGKGVYTWIDYNGDGVKDLNEFEIAAFPDQANYVRVFTPSDEYVKTYSNEFSQSLFFQPERLWSRKKGILKFLSRFSDQAQFRVARKSDEETAAGAFNPFRNLENDPSLISASSSLRNTFFFNRTSQVIGADYTYSALTNRILLANGYDQRVNSFHQLNFRWNIARKFTVKLAGEKGVRGSQADYTSGRDFRIDYDKLKPEFIYQPGTAFRISLLYRYEQKINRLGSLGETARIHDTGVEVRYNQLQKGSLTGTINWVNINFNGEANSALGFEMLEALKPGRNFTWTLNYQRNLGKNLQLSLRYNGRKSEDNRTIHTGGIEMRAFF